MSDPTPQPSEPNVPPAPPVIDPATEDPQNAHVETKSGDTTNNRIDVNNVEATNVTIIAEAYLSGSGSRVVFSIEQTCAVTADRASQTRALFVGDDAAIERMAQELLSRRILLLTGPEASGKAMTALYLSGHVTDRHGLPKPPLVVEPLERHISVDLRKVAATKSSFGGRVTVFTDAFGRANPELLGFFARADGVGWDDVAATLRSNNAFLVFTADAHAIGDLRQQLAQHIACADVARLSREHVLAALERKLGWLQTRGLATDAHVEAARASRESIFDQLRAVQRVSTFLDDFVRGEADVAAALRRFHDVDYWFSSVLANDLEAWAFAMTLALAEAARPNERVGWIEFERLRRVVTDALRLRPELTPRRAAAATNESGAGAVSLCDDDLFATCRAEVVREPGRLGDAVRFVDRSYANAIVSALFARHRRALTAVLPAIRRAAEDLRPGSEASRCLAAQVLGRAGELDPEPLALSLARDRWVRFENPEPLGWLLQGIWASDSDAYQRAALRSLDSVTSAATAKSDGTADWLPKAIVAYAQIGVLDPARAMERLGRIAVESLTPTMANTQALSRLADRVERTLARTASARVAAELLVRRLRLGNIASQIWKRDARTFVMLERAITYLCVMKDPIEILSHMRDWISKGGAATGSLVALLFLHGGIVDELEQFVGDANASFGSSVPSPIVLSLARGGSAVSAFASFLADVFATVRSTFHLPADLQRDFREEITDYLERWAKSATAHPVYVDAVADLFVQLATIRGGTLRDEVYSLLGGPAFATDPELRAFAANVRMKIATRDDAPPEEELEHAAFISS